MNNLKIVTKKRYIVNPLTIRAEIKRSEILRPYIGRWNGSKISGWGHFHGYIQIETVLININEILKTEYKQIFENVYTTKISLFAEFEHAKIGWTEKHINELKNILKKYYPEIITDGGI